MDGDLVSEFTAVNLLAAVADPSADLPHTTFTVREAAGLPQKAFLPNRGEFGTGGLLAGLFVGVIVALTAKQDLVNEPRGGQGV